MNTKEYSPEAFAEPESDRPVELDAAAEFLTAKFGSAVRDVTPLGHGEWSRAFAFRRGDAHFVARFGTYLEDFAKDRIAAGYGTRSLPIPRVIEIGRAFGGFYAVSQRAFGGYIDDLDGDRMRAVLPSLFAALDAARLVDLSGTEGYGGWGADGRGAFSSWRAALLDVARDRPEKRTFGWRERLAASPTGSGPFDEAFARLEALVDVCPEERHLVHSDLLHFNVLVEGDRVTAVLDWGCSLNGDFVYDVAWLVFWAPWYPAWRGIDFRAEAERHYAAIGLDVPRYAERLRCYQLHIGLDSQAYNAYRGNWPELAAAARRTLQIAQAEV